MSISSWLKVMGSVILWGVMAHASFAQTYNVLTSFTGPNGGTPMGALMEGIDGKLYGTTFTSGPHGIGTVFSITKTGNLTTLNGFCDSFSCDHAASPEAGLVQGIDGYLYGTTSGFACENLGYSCTTVFKMSPSGTLVGTYTFTTGGPGTAPLVQASNLNLYGVGSTAFEITPGGQLTTLSSLSGGSQALAQSPQGDFYFSTYYGGGHGFGAVYRMTPAGVITTVYDFCPETGCADGQYPDGPIVVGNDGNLYGTTTEGGGPSYGGSFFKLTPTGKFTKLYSFCSKPNCADGDYPMGLTQGSDGNFYGVTVYGGNGATGIISGYGILFKMTPTGAFTQLYNFCSQSNCADGANPFAALAQSTNGKFYGTAQYGGTNAAACPIGFSYGPCGTLFSLSVGLGPFVALPINTAPSGTTVGILGQGLSGTTTVTFNGTPASFTIKGDTYLTATVPAGATSGRVKVSTSAGTLTSNRIFYVQP